jgi:hypothetical protein
MAEQWTEATQRRVTFLSIFETLQGDYDASIEVVDKLTADGFFDEARSNPTPQRSERSARPASSSRPSNRGRDSGRPAFTGQMQNPTGPPSDKQVNLALKLTNDYTEDELWEMTKEEVSNIISDNKKF